MRTAYRLSLIWRSAPKITSIRHYYSQLVLTFKFWVITSKKIFLKNARDCVIYRQLKCSRYRPGVAQREDRVIALLFHDRDTRRWWMDSSTPGRHFSPWKFPVSIITEARWAAGPVWTGGKSHPHQDWIPDLPARSQSLDRLSCRDHIHRLLHSVNHSYNKLVSKIN